jgi:hypothetical protein
MKTQFGLYPQVENYDFDIKCNILNYEILKVANNNVASKASNKGSSFNEDSKEIIKSAASGDLFIFYNINCKCPGGNFPFRLEDVIIKIE